MRRHTLRTYTGQYKKQRMWNRDRKTWFEVMCLAVLAIWGGVAADLHPIAEAYYSLPDKIEIVRDSVDHSPLRGTASVNTGETAVSNDTPEVEAVSYSEPRESEEAGTPTTEHSPSSVEAKILAAWKGTGDEHIAVAVAKSESGKSLKTDAIGWNYYYYNAQGKLYSKACLPQDRANAWSVDCGVMQINHIGKTCPAHLFDPDENIRIGKSMYDTRGFTPWVTYWKGTYKNNL
jgi:hypothetical protein